MTTRRTFIKTFIVGGAALLSAPRLLSGRAATGETVDVLWPGYSADDPWAQVPAILQRIKPPSFPKRDFEVTRFGGVGDGCAFSSCSSWRRWASPTNRRM